MQAPKSAEGSQQKEATMTTLSTPRRSLARTSLLASLFVASVACVGAALAAGEPSGPDVLGIRVGMTHAEASAVLRTRAPKKNWQTTSLTLQFEDSRNQRAAVPNGTFRAALLTKKLRLTTETPDTYLAFFSPTPGDERVVAFVLNQYFLQQRPLLKDVTAQLVGKYGKPGEVLYDTQFLWAFDSKGAPRPLSQDQSGSPCRHVQQVGFLDQREVPSWSIDYKPAGEINRKPIDHVASCGAFMVRAKLMNVSADGFVLALQIELIGHELATAGKLAALRMIDDAKASELAGARVAAKKGPKPTF